MVKQGNIATCILKSTGEERQLIMCYDTDIVENITIGETVEGGKFCYYIDASTGDIIDKKDAYVKPISSFELFGIECGNGWSKLYTPIIEYIEQYNKSHPDEVPIEIDQIKEKFGGLRIYVSRYTPELHDMIRAAEQKSYDVCEECGSTVEVGQTGGWIWTVCKKCLQENVDKCNRDRKWRARDGKVYLFKPDIAPELIENK